MGRKRNIGRGVKAPPKSHAGGRRRTCGTTFGSLRRTAPAACVPRLAGPASPNSTPTLQKIAFPIFAFSSFSLTYHTCTRELAADFVERA